MIMAGNKENDGDCTISSANGQSVSSMKREDLKIIHLTPASLSQSAMAQPLPVTKDKEESKCFQSSGGISQIETNGVSKGLFSSVNIAKLAESIDKNRIGKVGDTAGTKTKVVDLVVSKIVPIPSVSSTVGVGVGVQRVAEMSSASKNLKQVKEDTVGSCINTKPQNWTDYISNFTKSVEKNKIGPQANNKLPCATPVPVQVQMIIPENAPIPISSSSVVPGGVESPVNICDMDTQVIVEDAENISELDSTPPVLFREKIAEEHEKTESVKLNPKERKEVDFRKEEVPKTVPIEINRGSTSGEDALESELMEMFAMEEEPKNGQSPKVAEMETFKPERPIPKLIESQIINSKIVIETKMGNQTPKNDSKFDLKEVGEISNHRKIPNVDDAKLGVSIVPEPTVPPPAKSVPLLVPIQMVPPVVFAIPIPPVVLPVRPIPPVVPARPIPPVVPARPFPPVVRIDLSQSGGRIDPRPQSVVGVSPAKSVLRVDPATSVVRIDPTQSRGRNCPAQQVSRRVPIHAPKVVQVVPGQPAASQQRKVAFSACHNPSRTKTHPNQLRNGQTRRHFVDPRYSRVSQNPIGKYPQNAHPLQQTKCKRPAGITPSPRKVTLSQSTSSATGGGGGRINAGRSVGVQGRGGGGGSSSSRDFKKTSCSNQNLISKLNKKIIGKEIDKKAGGASHSEDEVEILEITQVPKPVSSQFLNLRMNSKFLEDGQRQVEFESTQLMSTAQEEKGRNNMGVVQFQAPIVQPYQQSSQSTQNSQTISYTEKCNVKGRIVYKTRHLVVQDTDLTFLQNNGQRVLQNNGQIVLQSNGQRVHQNKGQIVLQSNGQRVLQKTDQKVLQNTGLNVVPRLPQLNGSSSSLKTHVVDLTLEDEDLEKRNESEMENEAQRIEREFFAHPSEDNEEDCSIEGRLCESCGEKLKVGETLEEHSCEWLCYHCGHFFIGRMNVNNHKKVCKGLEAVRNLRKESSLLRVRSAPSQKATPLKRVETISSLKEERKMHVQGNNGAVKVVNNAAFQSSFPGEVDIVSEISARKLKTPMRRLDHKGILKVEKKIDEVNLVKVTYTRPNRKKRPVKRKFTHVIDSDTTDHSSWSETDEEEKYGRRYAKRVKLMPKKKSRASLEKDAAKTDVHVKEEPSSSSVSDLKEKEMKEKKKMEGEWPKNTCEVCFVFFKEELELAQHLFEHANKSSFDCGDCESSFSRPMELHRHVIAEHKDIYMLEKVTRSKRKFLFFRDEK